MLTVTDWSGREYNALLTISFFEQNTAQRYTDQPMIYITLDSRQSFQDNEKKMKNSN